MIKKKTGPFLFGLGLATGTLVGFIAGWRLFAPHRMSYPQEADTFEKLYAQVPPEQRRLLLEFRAGHPYKQVEVADTPWQYLACGKGDETLLFLPGGFLKADMWFHAVSVLEDTYRVIAPDAFTLQGTFDMDGVCEALIRILDQERVDRATVIGLSAGGGVAQYLLQAHPERVKHLVLSHCGVLESDPEMEGRAKGILALVKILPLSIIRWALIRMTSGHLPPSSDWITFHDAYFREASARIDKGMVVNFLQGSLDARRDIVFRPEVLEAWPGRVLILGSKDDQLAMRSLEKLQTRYPRARAHLFEEGGHHTFMLFPDRYTTALKTFLSETKS